MMRPEGSLSWSVVNRMDAIPTISPAASNRAQKWFLGLLILLFVAVSIQYSFKVTKGNRYGQPRSAINRWASQIQDMETGEDIHKRHNYPNPPLMALMLWPFSELATVSPLAAALSWYYLKVLMAITCILWVFALVERPDRPFPLWAKLAAVALSIRPIIGDLSHGNINLFILFLVIGTLRAFVAGRDGLAGTLLALAITCKVTPALLAVYFLWKRAWKVLAGTTLGLALFFLVVPGLILGWEQNLRGLTSWIEVMILPFVVGGVVTPEHNNQSLPGLIARLLTAAPSFSTYIGDLYVPLAYHHVTDIGATGAKWLVKGCMGLFALLVIWTCRAPIAAPGKTAFEVRRGPVLASEFALILVGMLLFSERTWKHHCVTLLLPYAVLCYSVAGLDLGRATQRSIVGLTLASIALITATSTGIGTDLPRLQDVAEQTAMIAGPAGMLTATMSGLFIDSPGKMAQVYGAYVWAFFLIIGGLLLSLHGARRGQTKEETLPSLNATAGSDVLPRAQAA